MSIVRAFCAAIALIMVAAGNAALAQPAGSVEASSEIPKGRYVNVRFGYSIRYPTALMIAGQEADNSDGVEFHARKGKAVLAVWGEWKLDDMDQRSMVVQSAEEKCAGPPAYKVVKPALIAISCVTRKDEVLYLKTLLKGDQVVTMQMTYPVAERRTWDRVLERIAASLKVLDPGGA